MVRVGFRSIGNTLGGGEASNVAVGIGVIQSGAGHLNVVGVEVLVTYVDGGEYHDLLGDFTLDAVNFVIGTKFFSLVVKTVDPG